MENKTHWLISISTGTGQAPASLYICWKQFESSPSPHENTYTQYTLSLEQSEYGFRAQSSREIKLYPENFKLYNAKKWWKYFTFAKLSNMISRSPKKKVSWTSSQKREKLTESSLNEQITKDGDQEVQTAYRWVSVVLLIVCYYIYPKQKRRQGLSSLYSKSKVFQNDIMTG